MSSRIALRSGVNNLQEQKESFITLGERLILFGGLPVVSKKEQGVRASPPREC